MRAHLLWVGVLCALVAWGFVVRHDAWRAVRAIEPADIGRALAEGHGYSFPPGRRPLFQGDPADSAYGPTAWQEPLDPLLIAAAVRLGGARHPLVVVAMQGVFLLLTAIVLYATGRRLFGTAVGMLASGLLLLDPNAVAAATELMSTASLAGLTVMAAVLAAVVCAERPSAGRGALLGLALGTACLTLGAAMLLVPIAAVMLRRAGHPSSRRAAAIAAAGVLMLLLLPWWIRNGVVFHRFIPARSGFGQIAQVGNPILASTFVDGLAPCRGRQAPWRASGALDAIVRARESDARLPLEQLGRDCMRDAGGARYEGLDEVQRDAIARRQFAAFVRRHPSLFVRLVAARAVAYLWKWSGDVRLVLLLAVGGIALTVRRAECRAIAACIAALSVPYVLTMPYFLRYRYPIEPLLYLFAAYPVVLIAARCLALDGPRVTREAYP